MATYIGGLDIKPIKYNTASQFNLVFDCKPQRWLMSGETEITVADGEEITNPTMFESSPLLEVEGYGTIGFNDYAIELENATMGSITLAKQKAVTPACSTRVIVIIITLSR
jgi:phage-related protein